MDKLTEAFVTITGLVVGVATVAVIVSKNSNAGGVIQNLFSGFGNVLDVAVSPVTGATIAPNLSYAATNALAGVGGFPNFSSTGGLN